MTLILTKKKTILTPLAPHTSISRRSQCVSMCAVSTNPLYSDYKPPPYNTGSKMASGLTCGGRCSLRSERIRATGSRFVSLRCSSMLRSWALLGNEWTGWAAWAGWEALKLSKVLSSEALLLWRRQWESSSEQKEAEGSTGEGGLGRGGERDLHVRGLWVRV